MMKGVVSGQPALKGGHAASIREIMENISQHALLRGVARLKRSTVNYNYHYALHQSLRRELGSKGLQCPACSALPSDAPRPRQSPAKPELRSSAVGAAVPLFAPCILCVRVTAVACRAPRLFK